MVNGQMTSGQATNEYAFHPCRDATATTCIFRFIPATETHKIKTCIQYNSVKTRARIDLGGELYCFYRGSMVSCQCSLGRSHTRACDVFQLLGINNFVACLTLMSSEQKGRDDPVFQRFHNASM